jgi:polysaccharide biosynthesis protein PslG
MTGRVGTTVTCVPHTGNSRRNWSVVAVSLWLVALLAATVGLVVGRAVFERGVVYGADLPVLPDVSEGQRAINTQLELESDAESVRRSLRMLKAAGFTRIRQQFSWAAIEAGGKGQFVDTLRNRSNWERYDDIVRLAREEGVDVLARLDLPPEWARPPGSYKTHPPVDVRDYGDFVAAVVDRYRDHVRYVQLWNEPNLNEEWGRRPVDAAAYVELLRAGYAGAKRADAGVRVVTAALAQTLEPDVPTAHGLDDLLYMDRMFLAGAQPYYDVLAVNAYGLWTGPGDRRVAPSQANFARVLLARDVMVRHGDAGKAVWVAEFGWNALPPDWRGDPSPWGQVPAVRQAEYIVGAYDRAHSEWPWMGPLSLWLFRKPGADPRDPTPFFALVDSDWRPRPAYDALAATAQRPALGVGAHQETAPELVFSGIWQWTPDASASLGALRETPISGATLRFAARGSAIDLLAPSGPERGVAFVKVNGAYTLANRLPLNANGQATLDFYAPDPRPQARIPIASGLPDREHVVELTVTGGRNPLSRGAGVGIDAIVVGRSRPLLPLAIAGAAWAGTALVVAWIVRERLSRAIPSTFVRFGLLPWTRWLVFALAAALPFSPLGVRTPAGVYSPVEVCAALVAAVWITRLLLAARPGVSDMRWGAFGWPAALLVAGGLLSTFVADYPRLALRELRTLVVEPALVYLAARSVLRGQRDALWLAAVFVAGSAAAGGLALVQAVTGKGLVAAEGVARAAALYHSPNELALQIDRAMPLAVALWVGGEQWRGGRSPLPSSLSGGRLGWENRSALAWGIRPFFALVSLVLLGALFFTFSRGAWVACTAGVAVVAWPRARARAQEARLGAGCVGGNAAVARRGYPARAALRAVSVVVQHGGDRISAVPPVGLCAAHGARSLAVWGGARPVPVSLSALHAPRRVA